VEQQTAGLAERIQAAVDAHAVHLLAASAVDLQHLEERRDVPNVDEGDVGKLLTPFHGDADTIEQSEQPVDEVLAELEAFVGQNPHAVQGPDALGLSEDVLEADLDVVVDVVGVTVDQVKAQVVHVDCQNCCLDDKKSEREMSLTEVNEDTMRLVDKLLGGPLSPRHCLPGTRVALA